MKKVNFTNTDKAKGTYYFKDGFTATSNITDKGTYHGTHVAGIVAANGPEVTGVAGPIDEVRILPIKALGDDGSGYTTAVMDAIKWAAGEDPDKLTTKINGHTLPSVQQNVKVINLSLGVSRQVGSNWNDMINTLCPVWDEAAEVANQNNVTIVVAAGNSNSPLYDNIPAVCKNLNIIIAQATGKDGKRSYYSAYFDPKVDGKLANRVVVSAPGGDAIKDGVKQTILSTIGGNAYGYMQGTSMASPHVAGVISLLYTYNPDSNFEKIKDALEINSRTVINAKKVLTGQKTQQ
ncbi:S8 family serine peptidase [Allofrancisella guangzhouensis]|uniref:Peptidase S8/S53 domain-containing protein n=1 Tax=Allofrancisella guangzhouensis TaxID=594679 RepID=A0A0A8E4A9_9GAMM|nr:S8 family serine peptidase [Allofrancisella guangzhouensis]AJC48794.1 hypothetical protein SD28_03670 [Allofrancisella guangzhouensis]MBK2028016.1 S8 family serine peptidase [Allofrancisella guangzhouensis]MBK2044402.1 S8 family serine peptidase [Allofrancisella guangzhouensis]MBK2045292.1 S8 family serine peptidase [Allofrancisella guangzhouensis]